MQKVENRSASHILLTAEGCPAVAIPPTGRAKGRIDEGPPTPAVTLTDEQMAAFAETRTGVGTDHEMSQIEYFMGRGLVLL